MKWLGLRLELQASGTKHENYVICRRVGSENVVQIIDVIVYNKINYNVLFILSITHCINSRHHGVAVLHLHAEGLQ